MTKRMYLVLLALGLLLFSGCGCKHIWVGGTCEAPERCSICGKSQGTALGHDFGDWEFPVDLFGAENMVHTCRRCKIPEQAPIDWDLCIRHLLPGYWGLRTEYFTAPMVSVARYNSEYERIRANLPEFKVRDYVIFREGGTGSRFDGEALQEFCWDLGENYHNENQERRFPIVLTYADGNRQTLELNEHNMLFLEADAAYLVQEPMDWMEGTWQLQDAQTFVFAPDRTFTWVHPQGEISGTWYPHTDYAGGFYFEDGSEIQSILMIVILEYSENGQPQTVILEFYAEDSGIAAVYEQKDAFLADPQWTFCLPDQPEPLVLKKLQ